MGVKPEFRISANGSDISRLVDECFIRLTLTDEVGIQSDMMELTLSDNDPGNPIQIPPTGAELQLAIGYDGQLRSMGTFICDEVELAMWPGEMVIRARAAVYEKSKAGKTDLQSQRTRSWEEGTKLADMVKKIASEHSLEPKISNSLLSVVLPHIDQSDESNINLLTRIASKYDAVVKPSDGKLIVALRGESKSVSGKALPAVNIQPKDCSSCRMVSSKRETAGQVVAYWHAVNEAKRNEVSAGTGEPVRRLRNDYPTQELALAAARSELQRRQRGQQTLSVAVIGNPEIMAEAPLIMAGFRPGIDGQWLITRVRHSIDSSSGYTCDIEAEVPNNAA